MMTLRRAPALVLLALAAGCAGDREPDRIDTSAQAGSLTGDSLRDSRVSMVRMINAVPDLNALNVTSRDRSVFSAVDYKEVTQYQNLDETFARLRLQSGTRDTTLDTNFEIMMDGSRYTMIAIPDDDGGVRLRVLKDESETDSAQARLRVIHALPNVGEVDVLLQGQNDPLFDNLNFGNEGGFRDVTPARSTLVIRSADGNRNIARHQLNLEAGHAYTVVVSGRTGSVDITTVSDRAPNRD